MAHTVTITVDDTMYETLKPLIEQQTLGLFLSKVVEKKLPSAQVPFSGISGFRGSLHQVDISDIRDEKDRNI